MSSRDVWLTWDGMADRRRISWMPGSPVANGKFRVFKKGPGAGRRGIDGGEMGKCGNLVGKGRLITVYL